MLSEGGEKVYKVYIVDDDPVILDEIVNTVPWLDNGFEVVGSHVSPTAAIDEIKRLYPDVVFSDLKMPDMDGVDMIKALKESGAICEYVMLSAFDSFEDSRRFFRLEGFDYLLKPLQQEEVQIVLERLAMRLAGKIRPEPEDTCNMTPAFTELIQYLNRNFQQKHTLDSLSKQFNLAPNYICNLFAKHFNSTLTRYITELRMNVALQMMQTPGKAYKEIAIDCGYADYYYFCKVFKEFYGASPTGYMRNQQPVKR